MSEFPTKPTANAVRCTVCGTWMPSETNFCGVCGARMYTAKKAQRPPGPELHIIGRIVANRYKVLKLLGQGGMGSVYLVEHIYIGKLMAMKILHARLMMFDEVVRRFKREAESVSKLSSLHTVTVFDFGRFDDMFYIVMEYLKGKDLGLLLEEQGPMPPPRVVRITLQVCDSVAEAHDVGIVHRDLKPENIFLITLKDGRDFVKVLDFGLAKVLQQDVEDKGTLSGAGRLVGTPYYMSPEQIRNKPIDHRADIYSLGAVMYRMICGEAVFEGSSAMEVVSKHLTSPPLPLSSRKLPFALPPDLEPIVSRCLEKDQQHRYQDVEELATDLNRLISREGGSPLSLSNLPLAIKAVPRASAKTSAPAEPATTVSVEPVAKAVINDPPSPQPGPAEPVEKEHSPRTTSQTLDVDSDELKRDLNKSYADWNYQFDGDQKGSTWHEALESIELERIGTRKDFDYFETNLKRRRVWFAIIPLVLLLGGGFLFVWGYMFGNFFPKTWEREPNNRPRDANPLLLGKRTEGYLGKRVSRTQGDLDFYKFSNPHKEGSLSIDLEGVPNMDLAVEINCTGEDRFIPLNFNRRGEPERLRNIFINRPSCFLLVREQPPKDGKPTENSSDPYRLTVNISPFKPGTEEEPNSTFDLANTLAENKSIVGEISGRLDADVFQIDATLGIDEGVLVELKGDKFVEPRLYFTNKKGVVLSSGPFLVRKGVWRLAGYNPKIAEPLYLVVAGSPDSTTPRPYSVSFKRIKLQEVEPNNELAQANPILLGGRYRGKLATAQDVDIFKLAQPGKPLEKVRVELKAGGKLDLIVELRSADDKKLFTLNNSGAGDGEFKAEIDVSKAGKLVYFRVYSADPEKTSTDDYTLFVSRPFQAGKVPMN